MCVQVLRLEWGRTIACMWCDVERKLVGMKSTGCGGGRETRVTRKSTKTIPGTREAVLWKSTGCARWEAEFVAPDLTKTQQVELGWLWLSAHTDGRQRQENCWKIQRQLVWCWETVRDLVPNKAEGRNRHRAALWSPHMLWHMLNHPFINVQVCIYTYAGKTVIPMKQKNLKAQSQNEL